MNKELKFYRNKLEQAKGKITYLKDRQKEKEKLKREKEKRFILIEKAQAFIQKVAKDTQSKLKYHLEDVVQLALDACFPGEYEFVIEFEIKRGRTEADMFFLKDKCKMDIEDATGGGVVDMSAFALRLAVWSLSKTNPIMILDEPFRFLSRDLHNSAGEIMRSLSKKLGLQIIMSTHSQQMKEISDKVFEAKLVNGRTIIEEKSTSLL